MEQVLLLMLGSALTLLGGFLADRRTDKREERRGRREELARRRELQRSAIADVIATGVGFRQEAALARAGLYAREVAPHIGGVGNRTWQDLWGHQQELRRGCAVAALLLADAPHTAKVVQDVRDAVSALDRAFASLMARQQAAAEGAEYEVNPTAAADLDTAELRCHAAFNGLLQTATGELMGAL